MGIQDIVILLLIAGWAAMAVVHMRRKRGLCTGCGDCRNCGGCTNSVSAERTCNIENGTLQ